MSREAFVGVTPRAASSAVVFTFHAADFAGRAVTLVNHGDRYSFARVGRMRQVLAAGEEWRIDIPAAADYEIALGIGVRLEESR